MNFTCVSNRSHYEIIIHVIFKSFKIPVALYISLVFLLGSVSTPEPQARLFRQMCQGHYYIQGYTEDIFTSKTGTVFQQLQKSLHQYF